VEERHTDRSGEVPQSGRQPRPPYVDVHAPDAKCNGGKEGERGSHYRTTRGTKSARRRCADKKKKLSTCTAVLKRRLVKNKAGEGGIGSYQVSLVHFARTLDPTEKGFIKTARCPSPSWPGPHRIWMSRLCKGADKSKLGTGFRTFTIEHRSIHVISFFILERALVDRVSGCTLAR